MKTRQKSGFFDACFRALTALKSLVSYKCGKKMNKYARVAESADARDLKSLGLTAVSVQIRSRAPKFLRGIYKNASHFCY